MSRRFSLLRPPSVMLRAALLLSVIGLAAAVAGPNSSAAQPQVVENRFSDGANRPEDLTVYSDGSTTRLCFGARKPTRLDKEELFCTDGSTLMQVTNIGGPRIGARVRAPTVYDDGSGPKIYFGAVNRTGDFELWRSNGQSASQVADVNPSGSSRPDHLTVYNGQLYFAADGGSDGTELWTYDGTGVTQVKDINSGSSGSNPSNLIVYDGGLYFQARDGNDGFELWRFDGGSVSQIADINAGAEDSRPNDFAVYDDRGTTGADLYFEADGGSEGTELWRYDGSGTSRVTDINSGGGNSGPDNLTVYDAGLYFAARDGTNGDELWIYDGSSVTMVEDINTSGSSDPRALTVYDGELYFSADDGSNGQELWRYSGFSPILLEDVNTGAESSHPGDLTVFNGRLYFRANGGTGRELWRYDGGGGGLQHPRFENNTLYGPLGKIDFEGNLYFAADDGSSGRELWLYDGFGISRVKDINSGPDGSSPGDFTIYDDAGSSGEDLYFSADGGTDGQELWQYDGSSVSQVADVNSGSGDSFPTELTVFDPGSGPKLYFSALDGANGIELFVYGGSGVNLVEDINGSGSSRPGDFAVHNDGSGAKLYFSANNGSDGDELMVYDGNSVSLVEDLNPGSADSRPRSLVVYQGILYFAADDGSSGHELWGYNGTTVSQVADVNGSGDGAVNRLTVYDPGSGPKLYFRATGGSDGRELWSYDGSSPSQVADINGGPGNSYPKSFFTFGGQLYFTAISGTDGREAHAYNGSRVRSIDLNSGPPSGGGVLPTTYDDGGGTDLYVTATDGRTGMELWRIDKNSDPLPVELASFEVTKTASDAVDVTWTTASEDGNAGFRVQHRTPQNKTWETLGFLESTAGGGTTTHAQTYRFSADGLLPGSHTFRLEQVGLDGTTRTHEPAVIDLRMQQSLRLRAPAPNPARTTTEVSFAAKRDVHTRVSLFNVLGQRVSTIYEGTPPAGDMQTERLDLSALGSGTYLIRMTAGERTQSRRLTVVH